MLRVGYDDIAGPAGVGVAEVVEAAAGGPIAVGAVAAPRAGPPAVVAAAVADVGLGQVRDASDAFGGVGPVFTRSGHGEAPEGWSYQEIRPEVAGRSPIRPDFLAIDSIFF
jgi:hypothetical protein